jgi:hypothetical protein
MGDFEVTLSLHYALGDRHLYIERAGPIPVYDGMPSLARPGGPSVAHETNPKTKSISCFLEPHCYERASQNLLGTERMESCC